MRARLFGSICFAFAFVFAQGLAGAEETQKPSPAPQSGETKSGETLSEKLDRQKGVLKPKPGVDPQAEIPPPARNPDSMPVIRPPKTPGTEAK
ncbi:hypothetical protein [Methylocystis parvus]|uniref:hypothetical protein n=1 Tax=Methylocystis parvus TaxID=134 RepID=UPI003C74FB38